MEIKSLKTALERERNSDKAQEVEQASLFFLSYKLHNFIEKKTTICNI